MNLNSVTGKNWILKKFNEKGGISYVLAAFPTIKFPDQNIVVKIKIK